MEFLGHIGNSRDLADIFGGCELFLHPNPREPFGIAPLEAMACGLVLVAPSSGGVTEYADESNAMLVDATPSAFAEAVHTLLQRPGLLATKSRAAEATAKAFSIERMADALLDIYENIDAVTRGRLPLEEAGAAFRSTAPAATAQKFTETIAGLFKRGFCAWVRLRTRAMAS